MGRERVSAAALYRDGWAWVVAFGFVLLTLAALVAVPVIVQRHVDDSRAAIEGSEPARTLLMGLQYSLVREISTLNQFALTGDPDLATAFGEARRTEAQLWSDLAPLAADLGTDVHERFVQARTIADLWHQRLNEEELLRRGRTGTAALPTADVRRRFEDVLASTAALDSAILRTTHMNRAHIASAERSGLILTFISGAIALLAAGVVGSLVLRVRRLAAEAERGRRDAADALAEAARAADARQRLLRGITHDVKNPLGAARGYAELLLMQLQGELNAEQTRLAHGVERSIDSALAIIADLLDLARADSGGFTVHRVHADLNELARQAADDHRAAALGAGHEIRVQDGAGTLSAFTDPLRVRQVLDNLISNALKYTPAPGRITIRTEPNAHDAPFGRRAVAIRVTDTGPGIPPEQRERIFDEFTRLDDHGALKGHGLGLSIARRVARLLGGELGLSHLDQPGATFVLWLPQREQRDSDRDA